MAYSLESTIELLKNKSIDEFEIPGTLGNLIRKKREWRAFPLGDVNSFNFKTSHFQVLQRCLALALMLEIPVGYMTNGASESYKLEKSEMLSLGHNSLDELNHYDAFKFASEAYNMPYYYVDEFYPIQKEVLEFAETENFILLSGFLELSIFFVTLSMMRKYGESQLINVARYVSRDESCHVNTNYYLVDKYQLNFDNFLGVNQLRNKIINYLVEPLNQEEKDFWHNQSESLMRTRKAPELNFTKTGIMPKNFELPSY